jgi:hypothetical protein
LPISIDVDNEDEEQDESSISLHDKGKSRAYGFDTEDPLGTLGDFGADLPYALDTASDSNTPGLTAATLSEDGSEEEVAQALLLSPPEIAEVSYPRPVLPILTDHIVRKNLGYNKPSAAQGIHAATSSPSSRPPNQYQSDIIFCASVTISFDPFR